MVAIATTSLLLGAFNLFLSFSPFGCSSLVLRFPLSALGLLMGAVAARHPATHTRALGIIGAGLSGLGLIVVLAGSISGVAGLF